MTFPTKDDLIAIARGGLMNILPFPVHEIRRDNLQISKEHNMSDAEKDATHLSHEVAQAWDEYIAASEAVRAAKRAELVAWRRWNHLSDQLTVAEALLRARGDQT